MPGRALFLETSALLRMVFAEKDGVQVERALAVASRVVASRLIRVEAERALVRVRLDNPEKEKFIPAIEHELASLWARIAFIEVSPQICGLAGRIAPASRLRTLDAIHLATFQTAKKLDPALEMLTYDQRLLHEV